MNTTKETAHTITPSPAGKYARTKAPAQTPNWGVSGTVPPKQTTSQLMSVGRVPISGTTEVSPIVEVLNMADYTHNTTSVVPVNEPIFQASPSTITIRDFKPLESIHVQISLRNNDNVARRVKIMQPASTFFSVELADKKPASKVAPGMDIAYVLKFTPEERTDYFCDLVCFTEREKFIIPVRALGPRGWLDLPDDIIFEKAPVKAESVKTVLVRNVGDQECTYTISSTKPFRAEPPTATLGVGESLQIHFSFFPETTLEQTGEFRVDYTTGESVVVHATGRAQELAVRLDSHAMLMDPTYVTLFSQKNFKIINRSEDTLQFCFKQFASTAEEIKARMRYGASLDASVDEDGELDYDDTFKNDSFHLSPQKGEVWPNSEVEIVVTFTPATATEIACVAFCDIAGKENRFPVHLQGTGIGAKIMLSYNVIDIGEVFINSVSEYEVELDNQGEIGAHYELVPSDTVFGSKFAFSPSTGTLGVGQKEAIKVSFSSDVLGEFNEDFGWSLQGTPKPLNLTIRGKVIGPTFHLDETMLDFKRVSVAFLNSKHFHLFNTADIPFRFHFRVPSDGQLLRREFEVVPATGTILPHGKQKVQLDFIPLATKTYNLNLVMDIESVGEQMASIMIKGQSIVPEVTVSTHELDFGDCFLRYPYKKVIELVNHSDLPAKFELQPQDEISQCVATYEVDHAKGTIEPFQQRLITVSFTTERLDKVQLPMFFRIIGHDDEPLEIQCIANGCGPKLTVTPAQIKWGDIEVLKEFEKTLKIKNDSLIPADFQTLVMKRNSRFKVNMPSCHLAPGETANLKLTAFLDDTQQFKDELCLVVTEGGEIKVPLVAKGTGTTIQAKNYEMGNEPKVDLGFQFTSRMSRKAFQITNRGPKPQTLNWYNGTALAEMQRLKAAAAAAAEENKKKKQDDSEIVVNETFHVEINGSTEPFVIEPGATALLEIIGNSKKVGQITEKLCCRSKMEKEQRVIIEMSVTADFIDPVVEFSSTSLNFEYNYEADVPLEVSEYGQAVNMKNVCQLPLQCFIKSSGMPFTVEPTDVDLQPGETTALQISFDPGYRGDRVSEIIKQNLNVTYNIGPAVEPKNDRASAGVHPKKALVELNGEMNYPNLKLDKQEIKFGAVLNDTTRRIKVKCTNTSKIDAMFSWAFVVSDGDNKKRPGSSGTTIQSSRMDPPHPINMVFDILPIRSHLKPGQSEDVEFVFYGHANHKYRGTAVAEVLGGPEYEVKIDGEASSIQYKFDKTSIDFGNALYDKFGSEELILHNTGKVKFDFNINTDSVAPPTIIKAVPSSAVVAPQEKIKIQIQIYPGVPTFITTSFVVDVAHFEPQVVVVTGKGIFPHIGCNLPRIDPGNYARLLAEAQSVLGLIGQTGSETARTEGMPGVTARTAGTDATEAMRSGAPNDSQSQTRRTTGQRPPSMSMETFMQTNPFVRQLMAEADCLGMREYIMEQVAMRENEEEARRVKVIFDEEKEREMMALMEEDDPMLGDSLGRPAAQTRTQPSAPPGPGAGDGPGGAEGTVSIFKTGEPFIDMRLFILAEYVCDFGNVIKGQQLQKEFRVRNVGFSLVSFEFPKALKSALTNAGFVIEPDRVNRLPGAPDFEIMDFSVLFNSSRPGVVLGPIDMKVPLTVRNGPQVNVYLKANVTIPDVEVSSESLKFGAVFCGHSRTITVQLKNKKEIPASWSFAQALLSEGGASKPTDDFTVIPAKGVLNPGETCNVQIVFHPRTEKTYTVKIPLKIAQNPAKRGIKVAAQSENLAVRFEPPMLELAPILPFVTESEHKVTIYNDTDSRIEFYSVDFDEQYKKEEEILRRIEIYQPEGITYREVVQLPLRYPGNDLQPQILEAWAPVQAADEAAAEAERKAAEAAAAAAEAGEEGEAPAEDAEPAEPEAAEAPEDSADADVLKVGELIPVETDTETVNMLVYGHPLTGHSRVAKGLARKSKIGLLNLKSMLEDNMKEAGIEQFMEEQEAEEEGEPPKKVAVPNKYQLNKDAQPSGICKVLQEVFFPPPPPPEEGAEEAPADPPAEGEEPVDPGPRTAEIEEGWLKQDLLVDMIKDKMLELQYVRGVCVDGVALAEMPPPDVAKAVEKAMSGKNLSFVLIGHEPAPEPEEAPAEEAAEGEEQPAEPEPEKEAPPTEQHEEEEFQPDPEPEDGDIAEGDEEGEQAEMEIMDTPMPPDTEPEVEPPEDFGPEEEYTEEELEKLVAEFDEHQANVLAVFEPPPLEEGEEPPAEPEPEEGVEKPPALPPTISTVVRLQRIGKQPVEEVIMFGLTNLPESGPLPGEARSLKIPAPFDREIITRPFPRGERRRQENFYILTPEEVPDEEAEEEAPAEGEEEGAEPKPKTKIVMNKDKTRWVIEPKSSIELVVKMKSNDTGRCEAMLGFEIMGGGVVMRGREFNLPVRGMCVYPQMSQSYQSLYYRRLKTRQDHQIVSKYFIVSKNMFEFGPLLVGKNKQELRDVLQNYKDRPMDEEAAEERQEKETALKEWMDKNPDNWEKFRITNNGLFEMDIDFCFRKDEDGSTFLVEPEKLHLALDETQDITVFAMREEEGEFADQLICNIKNNPEPVEINISCVGSIPTIQTDVDPTLDEEGNVVEGPLNVEFQRLLVGRRDNRIIKITNVSLLAAKWTLTGVSEEEDWNCGKEFTVTPTVGTLLPRQTEEITISFNALDQEAGQIQKPIALEWTDLDGVLAEPLSTPMNVTAEAYQIEYAVPQAIDFGIVKVVDGGEQTFQITNSGKYKVGYRFAFARPKKSIAAKYFTIEVEDEGDFQGKSHGELEPESTANIKIKFNSSMFPGQEEVDLKENTELKYHVSELLTGEEIYSDAIKLTVRSVFSKYRVLPQKGISFGALTYETNKSRTFDIVNQGEFEFNFNIVSITNLVRSRPGTAGAQRGEPEQVDGGLKVGNFTVKPSTGTVQPNGQKETITVEFEATGQAQFFEVLGIKVDDRDPAQDKDGMPYELTGESCIPGLLNSDFLQIFEEAAVLRKAPADPTEMIKNTFIEEERAFHFGPRLVNSRNEIRIKIINPTKVPIEVDLKMEKKEGDEELAFELVEEKLSLPMHEHRYATVIFTPTALKNFYGVFEATVQQGTDEKTNKLVFDMRGEGTLPRVTITEPSVRNAAGQALFTFNRLLRNRTQSLPLKIVNQGILPATVRFGRVGVWPPPTEPGQAADGPACFSFSGRGAEIFLNPKEEKSFEMNYRPKEVGTFSGSIEMVVQNNEFERNIIELQGECFEQDVSFDNMPGGAEDELKFGDIPVGVPKQMNFSLSNNSLNSMYRFEWLPDEEVPVTFVPTIGHIQPGQTKEFVGTIFAKGPTSLEARPLPLKVTEIKYKGDIVDWDDSMKDVEWVTEGVSPDGDTTLNESSLDASVSSPVKIGRKKKPKKIVKVRPEPEYEPVLVGDPPEEGAEDERTPKEEDVICKISAESAFLEYKYVVPDEEEEEGKKDVDTLPTFVFAETMMYRDRVHKFTFKNSSKASFNYEWRVCFPDGTDDLASDSPFTVEPSRGSLGPEATVEVTVRFSPTEVDNYTRKIVGYIPHLATRLPKPEKPVPEEGEEEAEAPAEGEEENAVREPQPQPEIMLSGRSARPLCHIELQESDWLSGGRRPPTLATPGGAQVDPSSHCLEFESLGTQVRNTKRFFVMNPTNISYKFRWECEDGTGAAVAHLASAFKCIHKEGIVLSGKKAEMVFEYTPESDNLLESFWRFHIPEHNISVPFILVGHVKEPRVMFDKTYCNFNSLLLHHKSSQTVKLVNREHIPFVFSFDGKTYGADEDPPVCHIHPSQGTVGPDSELPITVTFTPKIEKNYNFNAVCNVKKKATRLALNIKGEGFDNHTSVAMEEERGAVQVLPASLTPLDFGEVHVNERRVKTVSVTNKGKYPVEFEWRTAKTRQLTIKPEKGIVPKGDKVDVSMAFHPTSEINLIDHAATLHVVNGAKYNFAVSATGRRPLLAFSFQRMDFGPCFIYRQGMQPSVAVLRLTNEDTHDISFDVEFDNKPHMEIDASPTNLAPGQSEEIRISFMPRELKEYVERIPFDINGLYRITVEIRGTGHECDVALANSAQFNYALGQVKVGTVLERRIKVRNNSPVHASVSIAESVKKMEALNIQLRPAEFHLRPRESTELELVYAPSGRMMPFSEDLKIDVGGLQRTLMVLNGSAVGVELKLETDMLFFGAVVANSKTVRRVQLENVGDIGTKFRWAADSFQPDFSVTPTEGFLNPHDEMTLEFFFHPQFVNDDIRRDSVPLFVEGADPLYLTATGICVSQQPKEEGISFDTPVRVPVTQTTPGIQNTTDTTWRLVPVLDNDYWTGPEILEIPPGQEVGCKLTYKPLAMTSDEVPAEPAEGEDGEVVPKQEPSRPTQHTGTVFIPLPDGTAVMYNLTGKAGPPNAEGPKIEREVQCKASHTEPIPVINWLNRPQRFTVKIEPPPEGTTTLKGANYIDVPANAERAYALKFHTFVEGTTEAKVTLTNEETGEYLFYEIAITAVKTPVLATFDLGTIVRQGKELEIDLANPLSKEVKVTATCDNPDIVLQPEYDLRPLGETPCKIIFRPLLPTKGAKTLVTFSSDELGDFVYELSMTAAAAGADRSIPFKAAIGGVAVQTFRFQHYLQSGASYQCSCDNPVFTIKSGDSVSAPAAPGPEGVEVEVEISFEPEAIGECNSKLTVSSEEGGEYVCILNGHGIEPVPQGPFEVPGSLKIDFKNPFSVPKSFTVAVDNENFTVANRLDDVAARSSIPLNVAFRAGEGSNTAKLTVMCDGLPPWLYYLKGV